MESHLDDLTALESALPGITALLSSSAANDLELSEEARLRSLLTILCGTPTFAASISNLHPDVQKLIREFIAGKSASDCAKGFSVPVPGNTKLLDAASASFLNSSLNVTLNIINVTEDDGSPVQILVDSQFSNWSSTVSNIPSYTFVPKSLTGLQNIVTFAASAGKRVRAAGFRQTWSELYQDNGDILVSLLPLHIATGDSAAIWAEARAGHGGFWETIEFVGPETGGERLVRVGAGCTTERFRLWALQEKWTLPSNVIPVENCFGGIIGSIPHGSGWQNNIPNDCVRVVEYVDAHGVHQRVDNAAHIKTAAGSFGLLGIVTHLTFALKPMTYSLWHPLKQHIQLAVPPPLNYPVPEALKANFTADELAAAEKEFERKAEGYYCEWFWFPYKSDIWVNCWNVTSDGSGAVEAPDEQSTFIAWLQNSSDKWLNEQPAFKKFSGGLQGSINGDNMFNRSPPNAFGTGIAKTPVINAIHYRRGTQNFPILDTEFSMPIPPSPLDSTKPNWEHARRAYWDAVSLAYDDEHKTGACRIGVEMRIIGGSEITMGPQTGNKFGTITIEVISTLSAGEDGSFKPWTQRVLDKWMALGGNIRPHWGKQWQHLKVNGQPIQKYLKEESYRSAIPAFKATIEAIGKDQGWTWDDLHKRFSNKALDELFFS